MASSKALVIQSGITKQIPNGDTLLVSAGIDAYPAAGTLSVGGPNSTVLSLGDDNATTTISMGGGTGLTSMSIGTSGALTSMDIGTGMGVGDSIDIGGVGSLVTIKGDLQVDGAETVTGISTFNNNAIFNGDVQFGDAATDLITFTGVVVGNRLT